MGGRQALRIEGFSARRGAAPELVAVVRRLTGSSGLTRLRRIPRCAIAARAIAAGEVNPCLAATQEHGVGFRGRLRREEHRGADPDEGRKNGHGEEALKTPDAISQRAEGAAPATAASR